MRAKMISLPMISVSYSRMRWRASARTSAGSLQEPARQIVLQPADAAVRVVHARAGDRLHQVLDHLALAERVEDRRHRAELQRVRADEHQVVQDPVPLGEHRADPLRALRHLDAGQPLDRDRPAELVVERAQPVVAVHQHQHLAGVAVLGELLGRPVHVADHRLGARDDLAVELEHHPEHAVGRRVLRPDVEDHLLGLERAGGDDVDRRRRGRGRWTCELWNAGRSVSTIAGYPTRTLVRPEPPGGRPRSGLR